MSLRTQSFKRIQDHGYFLGFTGAGKSYYYVLFIHHSEIAMAKLGGMDEEGWCAGGCQSGGYLAGYMS